MSAAWMALYAVARRVVPAAALGLLAACAAPTHQGMGIVQTFPECSKPDSRAFLAADGSALVMHCRDGSARAWSERKPAVEKVGTVVLFDLARERGLIPHHLRCASFETFAPGADCDVIDQVADGSAYIVNNTNIYSFIKNGTAAPERLFPTFSGGVLLPRSGPARELITEVLYENQRIETRSLHGAAARPFAAAPRRMGFLQSKEGRVHQIRYSDAHELVLVSWGDIFMYFKEEVPIVRAYSLDGTERWVISKPLPKPTEHGGLHAGIEQIYGTLVVFDGGRHAALSWMSWAVEKPSFDIIDLASGKTRATLEGRVLGGSAKGSRLLVHSPTEGAFLIDVAKVLAAP